MLNETEREIKICALMLDPYNTSPGQRFRIEQWEPFLIENGISIDYFSFTNDNLKRVIYEKGQIVSKVKELIKANINRIGHILNASKYDAVFLYRAASMIGPAWFEKFLGWRKIPIIFDFDDAIFLTDTSKANERFGWAKFAGKTAEICRLSTSVTVGNPYLADYAKNYNERVYIVPTSIDTNRYQPFSQKKEKNSRIIVGWTGSSTSQYHLEEFEPVLVKLLKERNVEIRVISNREPSFNEIPYVWRAWSPETEIEEISNLDVGIMPTPDDKWARGKCALKALQYMSLGIPAVCTDMGANREVINHGENGFLAKNSEEWLDSLKNLIDDPVMRTKFGNEARKTVVENYSMEKCAHLFAQVVQNTIENNKRERKN